MVDCHIYGEAGYYPPLTPVAGTGVKNLTLVFRTGKVLTEVNKYLNRPCVKVKSSGKGQDNESKI